MTERIMWTIAWLLEIAGVALLVLGVAQHNAAFDFGAFFAAVEGIAFALGALSYE